MRGWTSPFNNSPPLTPSPDPHPRDLDLSDAAHPILGPESTLSTQGLTRTDRQPDGLNNFDIALDTSHHRFIAIREQHPYPASDPQLHQAALQIISIPEQDLRKESARWTVEAEITPALTHFPRKKPLVGGAAGLLFSLFTKRVSAKDRLLYRFYSLFEEPSPA